MSKGERPSACNAGLLGAAPIPGTELPGSHENTGPAACHGPNGTNRA